MIGAGVSLLLALVFTMFAILIDIPGTQLSTILIVGALTFGVAAPIILLYALRAPVLVRNACKKFVVLEGIHPNLTSTLPYFNPLQK